MLTIDAVRALQAALESQITELLQGFQTTTGLTIHSVPLSENAAGKPAVTARVKVQL